MSRTVKDLMTKTYEQMFSDIDGAIVVDIRGIPANENNALRDRLRQQQIKVTVIKNNVARRAFEETAFEQVKQVLGGPCAFAYGVEGNSVVNVARELLKEVKAVDELEVRGAFMEGAVFGADEVERLSKYPTREEQLADFLALVLSPGRNLARAIESPGAELSGAVKGPAGQVAGLLAAVKTKLEDGETIAKAG